MSRFAVLTLAACLLAGCAKSKSPTNDTGKTGSTPKSDSGKTDSAGDPKSKKTGKALAAFTPPAEITLKTATVAELTKFIADHKGQAVFVDFWGIYCPPCRREFPHTVELSKKYAKDGLVVVSVCIDAATEKEAAIKFLKDRDANIVNFGSPVEDIEESLAAFEIEKLSIPHYRVYDAEGKLVLSVKGGKEKEINAAITKVLGYE